MLDLQFRQVRNKQFMISSLHFLHFKRWPSSFTARWASRRCPQRTPWPSAWASSWGWQWCEQWIAFLTLERGLIDFLGMAGILGGIAGGVKLKKTVPNDRS